MEYVEKLGLFYLGKPVEAGTSNPILLDSKDLTTHAVILGMTGSGKTGLGISLLEEAAIDGIPSLVIDPKGDLANLLLTFPELSAAEFLPWVDEREAQQKGMDPKAYAALIAKQWQEGLAEWGEGKERIQKLKNVVKMQIYTPASKAGTPLSILHSLSSPSKDLALDTTLFRDRIASLVSSLFGLLGIDADPVKSREHIFLSHLIEKVWNQGKDLSIATLIEQIQTPPFDTVGVLDLETFYPSKERKALAISFNNLLASPGFQAWMEGEPLSIKELLYTKEGKPKLSILSIAHLSDAERMFFVTLLLSELISWMRLQSGTPSLRALLYMDEVFGFFPPTATPPSKKPMITLLKQARAFGLGVVLSTQNPVDLDYKGLSNCGTWFIGKLQTERDRARVLDGLSAASNGEMNAATLNKQLSSLASRTFILRSVHQKDPIVFQTRWTLSYLRGPLTLAQIATLSESKDYEKVSPKPIQEVVSRPIVPAKVRQYFLPSSTSYRPFVLGVAKLHFVDGKNKIDVWKDVCLLAPASEDGQSVKWEEAVPALEMKKQMIKEMPSTATFTTLPAGLMQEKNYSLFEKLFQLHLFQHEKLLLLSAPELGLTAKEGELEGEFQARVDHTRREKRDALVKELQEKYSKKIAFFTTKERQLQEKAAQKQQKVREAQVDGLIAAGSAILGAFLGRGVTKGTISLAGSSLMKVGKSTAAGETVAQIDDDLKACQQQISDLQAELKKEMDEVPDISVAISKVEIAPRKSDITISEIALLWR